MTGNAKLVNQLPVGMDFGSSAILSGNLSLSQIGADILQALIETANDRLTWDETLNYKEATEVWFDGPFF